MICYGYDDNDDDNDYDDNDDHIITITASA
jgi:hypothetical protein